MIRNGLMLAGAALVVLPATAALAQMQPATGATGAQPGMTQPGATTAPATGTAGAGGAAASGAAAVTAGAQVVDTSGGAVGSIESVSNGVAVLSTGTNKVSVPASSFAQGQGKLVIAMTKADIDAKASQATAAANAAPVEIAAGATVSDPSGARVGTVKSVSGDMVTVAGATASAQLPKSSFAKGPSGLVIGMTAADFEKAAKAAGGAKPGSAS